MELLHTLQRGQKPGKDQTDIIHAGTPQSGKEWLPTGKGPGKSGEQQSQCRCGPAIDSMCAFLKLDHSAHITK
jgi:hypothetical protein